MNDPNERRARGEDCHTFDPDGSVESLLDHVGDWLEYAGGLHEVLADQAADATPPDPHQLACLLGTVAMLIRMSAQSVRQAKVRYVWDAKDTAGDSV